MICFAKKLSPALSRLRKELGEERWNLLLQEKGLDEVSALMHAANAGIKWPRLRRCSVRTDGCGNRRALCTEYSTELHILQKE